MQKFTGLSQIRGFSFVIIDATQFFHIPGEGTLARRNEHIMALCNQAGVKKFAFVVTGRASGTVEKGAQPAHPRPGEVPGRLVRNPGTACTRG